MKKISAKEARQQGLPHYFTGVPCVKGHITKRYATNNRCVICCDNVRRRCERNNMVATLRAIKRRAAKLKRTPLWSNKEEIDQFYLNTPRGMTVDHIIPLQGELVSGLHVLDNLQYLTKAENSRKKNKYEVG